MPNKRSKRNQAQRFFCPYCDQRLWRLGGHKHQDNVLDKHTKLSADGGGYVNLRGRSGHPQQLEKRSLSWGNSPKQQLNQGSVPGHGDELAWSEEFVCEQHGKMQMLVTRKADQTLSAVPTKNRDRHRTPSIETLNAPKLKLVRQ